MMTLPSQAMQTRLAVPSSSAGQRTISSVFLPLTGALPVSRVGTRKFKSVSCPAAAVQGAAYMQASPQYECLQGSMVRHSGGRSLTPEWQQSFATELFHKRMASCSVDMQVYQVAEQRKTDITELWGNNEVSVIFWARSMGCFFCQ